jgi:hypothetical protein
MASATKAATPWTKGRVAKVRKSIREAFAEASISAGRLDADADVARSELDGELKEALALVSAFAKQNGLT